MRGRFLIFGLAFVCGSTSAAELRCQTSFPSRDVFGEFVGEAIGKQLADRLPELKVGWLPAGAVVPRFQIPDAVAKGTLDCGIATTTSLARLVPGFRIYERPFSFDGFEDVVAFQSGEAGEILRKELAQKGLVFVSMVGGSFSHIAWNKTVNYADAIKGSKLSTGKENPTARGLEAIGSKLLPMDERDLRPALVAGAVDGFAGTNSELVAVAKGLDLNFVPYNSGFSGYALIFNRAVFDSFDLRQRKALMEVGAAAQAEAFGAARKRSAVEQKQLEDLGLRVSPIKKVDFIKLAERWNESAPADARRLTNLLPEPFLKGRYVKMKTIQDEALRLPSASFESEQVRSDAVGYIDQLVKASRTLEAKAPELSEAHVTSVRFQVDEAALKAAAIKSKASYGGSRIAASDVAALKAGAQRMQAIAERVEAGLAPLLRRRISVAVSGVAPPVGPLQVYVLPAAFLYGSGVEKRELLEYLSKWSFQDPPPATREYDIFNMRLWIGPALRYPEMVDMIVSKRPIKVRAIDEASAGGEIKVQFVLPDDLVRP